MSGTIYKTRELFEVARNEKLKLSLCGTWYRHGATDWAVFDDTTKVVHRMDNYANALAMFERLVEDRSVEVTP